MMGRRFDSKDAVVALISLGVSGAAAGLPGHVTLHSAVTAMAAWTVFIGGVEFGRAPDRIRGLAVPAFSIALIFGLAAMGWMQGRGVPVFYADLRGVLLSSFAGVLGITVAGGLIGAALSVNSRSRLFLALYAVMTLAGVAVFVQSPLTVLDGEVSAKLAALSSQTAVGVGGCLSGAGSGAEPGSMRVAWPAGPTCEKDDLR